VAPQRRILTRRASWFHTAPNVSDQLQLVTRRQPSSCHQHRLISVPSSTILLDTDMLYIQTALKRDFCLTQRTHAA